MKIATLRTANLLLNLVYLQFIGNPIPDPLINANEEGELVFEYWYRDRKLAIYIKETTLSYIKVWGPDIDSEMEDGEFTNLNLSNHSTQLKGLFDWLKEE